jgi:hypothetical protein
MDAARGERLDARRCLGLLRLLTLARTVKRLDRPPSWSGRRRSPGTCGAFRLFNKAGQGECRLADFDGRKPDY